MGGERSQLVEVGRGRDASSPRGRGTPPRGDGAQRAIRFIPAWAGNAHTPDAPPKSASVHPRVGGERRSVRARVGCAPRFIPAWAGNAPASGASSRAPSVHPRVGGERAREVVRGHRDMRFIPAWAGNAPASGASSRAPSVHPRVGGERVVKKTRGGPHSGSSPRGRGTRGDEACAWRGVRFIPAWAGNATTPGPRPPSATVHPRVGGERTTPSTTAAALTGSSPRGRGTRCGEVQGAAVRRFIPAWAGNAQTTRRGRRGSPVHPRVGGERTAVNAANAARFGSSPRGRGTLDRRKPHRQPRRFIPAWAGNARPGPGPHPAPPVHPRVGGERLGLSHSSVGRAGSSPRGRGTRRAGGTRCPRAPVHPRVGGERRVSDVWRLADAGSSPRGRGTP